MIFSVSLHPFNFKFNFSEVWYTQNKIELRQKFSVFRWKLKRLLNIFLKDLLYFNRSTGSIEPRIPNKLYKIVLRDWSRVDVHRFEKKIWSVTSTERKWICTLNPRFMPFHTIPLTRVSYQFIVTLLRVKCRASCQREIKYQSLNNNHSVVSGKCILFPFLFQI